MNQRRGANSRSPCRERPCFWLPGVSPSLSVSPVLRVNEEAACEVRGQALAQPGRPPRPHHHHQAQHSPGSSPGGRGAAELGLRCSQPGFPPPALCHHAGLGHTSCLGPSPGPRFPRLWFTAAAARRPCQVCTETSEINNAPTSSCQQGHRGQGQRRQVSTPSWTERCVPKFTPTPR